MNRIINGIVFMTIGCSYGIQGSVLEGCGEVELGRAAARIDFGAVRQFVQVERIELAL